MARRAVILADQIYCWRQELRATSTGFAAVLIGSAES
jgi:hypothetical protein